jgi:hypothetical protein
MWEARGRNVLQPLCEGDGQRPECPAASRGEGGNSLRLPPSYILISLYSICNIMNKIVVEHKKLNTCNRNSILSKIYQILSKTVDLKCEEIGTVESQESSLLKDNTFTCLLPSHMTILVYHLNILLYYIHIIGTEPSLLCLKNFVF